MALYLHLKLAIGTTLEETAEGKEREGKKGRKCAVEHVPFAHRSIF